MTMAESPWRFTARMKGEYLRRSKITTETRPFGLIRTRTTREEKASSPGLVRRGGAGLRRQEERA